MNQKEITSNIALKLGTTQKSVDDCLNALNEEIISALKTEGRVQINLGVFEIKNRAARVAEFLEQIEQLMCQQRESHHLNHLRI